MRRFDDPAGFSLVELLVTISILSIVALGVTSVVTSALRAEQFQRSLQEVTDDGRISMERIRKELREARRLLPDSCQTPGACEPSAQLHFWVDHDQDNIQDPEEMVCYKTRSIGAGQFILYRETADMAGSNVDTTCRATDAPVAAAQVLAETLIDAAPFTDMDPDPTASATDRESQTVQVTLQLQVVGQRGPDSLTFQDRVRLRNVA